MDNQEKRVRFRCEFQRQIKQHGLAELPCWFEPAGAWDSIMCNWVSEAQGKVLRLQEADDDEILKFTYAFGATGENRQYRDLFLQFMNVHERAAEVFDIYRHWFLEDWLETQLDPELEQLERSLT